MPILLAPHPARTMRIVATGLLIAMAVLFAIASRFVDADPAWGYVRAFAEAAMVGGLADWFAVTALFRHPLGLPIPHTAIIPRNKDRIGDTLAAFLKTNFLTPVVVTRRMARIDVAAAAGRFLAAPQAGGGRIRQGASRLVASMLEALDQERLGGMVKSAIVSRLDARDVAPLLGQALTSAMADGRHLPVLEALVRWSARTLDANEALIRTMVHEKAGSVMRWTGLDETLANKIVDGLRRLLDEMAENPSHPVRLKAEQSLASLAGDLQHDADLRLKVEAMKRELIANPAVGRWIEGLWETARASLLRSARDPEAALAGKFGEMLQQLGATLQSDATMKRTINRFVRRATVGLVAAYGDGIVRLVSDTIRGWDARTITARLEHAVGRDLQYIRVNGTLVGGLVGVVIHAVEGMG